MLIPAAATSSAVLRAVDTHRCCKFLDLEFSFARSWPTNMLITIQTVSPLHKTFVPSNHSTTNQSLFAVRLLNHLQRFTSEFAYFLLELEFFTLYQIP
jgi:hypothetical protein